MMSLPDYNNMVPIAEISIRGKACFIYEPEKNKFVARPRNSKEYPARGGGEIERLSASVSTIAPDGGVVYDEQAEHGFVVTAGTLKQAVMVALKHLGMR